MSTDHSEAPTRWSHVPTGELLALHRVALQAREAVAIAAAAGVHLGPLRAALDETAYRTPGWLGRRRADAEQID